MPVARIKLFSQKDLMVISPISGNLRQPVHN